MGSRNDDISIKLAKAVKAGFFPEVSDTEVDMLEKEARILFNTDAIVGTETNLVTGESIFDRRFINSNASSSATQSMRLTYFTARKTETVSSIRVISGGTAAAATPTLIRIGLYLVEDNNDLTLVASTPNDTTLFAATFTAYTKAFSVPYVKIAGKRYAVGILVVTAVAAPHFQGNIFIQGIEALVEPKLSAYVNTISDLPASILNASQISGSNAVYSVLLP